MSEPLSVTHELLYSQQERMEKTLEGILETKTELLVKVTEIATKLDERKEHSDLLKTNHDLLEKRVQKLEQHRSNVVLIGSLALFAIGALQVKILVTLPTLEKQIQSEASVK